VPAWATSLQLSILYSSWLRLVVSRHLVVNHNFPG
jgi:hypothetical protein